MKTIFLLLIFIFFSFNSCNHVGCTDPDAINVDLDAEKNDGSCKYNNDIYLGVYTASDTIDNDLQFGLFRSYATYEFEIKRDQGNKIRIKGFFKCSEDLVFSPDSQSVAFYGYMFCDKSLNAYFESSGNTLKYNCIHSNSSGQTYRWGTAIKQ